MTLRQSQSYMSRVGIAQIAFLRPIREVLFILKNSFGYRNMILGISVHIDTELKLCLLFSFRHAVKDLRYFAFLTDLVPERGRRRYSLLFLALSLAKRLGHPQVTRAHGRALILWDYLQVLLEVALRHRVQIYYVDFASLIHSCVFLLHH